MWTMKLFLLSLWMAIMISKTCGYPVAELTGAKNDDSSKYAGVRQRRVTCDLLSFMGDSACAANCLSMGKAGGSCQDGICVCRRDTFEDVWEKRFGPIPTYPPFDVTVKPFKPIGIH